MTYAPADLLTVQRYAHDKTGQDWASLGIVGDTSHNSSGGYHVGHDVLHALDRAPEDPGSDYSYTESQRDRRGLTGAASAFDMGGDFEKFLAFNAWIVGRARAGDPRCRDIREIIHTLDGRTVHRWDALDIRSTGDSSHLSHTHFSFFRDSEGRRAGDDNFLGLLKEFFDGATPSGEADMDPNGMDIVKGLSNAQVLKDIWDYVVGGRPGGDNPVGRFRSPNGWKQVSDAIKAQPAAAVTLGADLAAALVARPDTPLGEADIPTIQAALDLYFRTRFGQAADAPSQG